MTKSFYTTVIAATLAAAVALPSFATAAPHHMMMKPTAKYGPGFMTFSTHVSDCMDSVMPMNHMSNDLLVKQFMDCMHK